jgi:hypothetical protein
MQPPVYAVAATNPNNRPNTLAAVGGVHHWGSFVHHIKAFFDVDDLAD